jgi:hypothetical protein
LREECRLRVFENRVLRRIFGPKRKEVTGAWIRLHKEELYALYPSPNIIRVTKSRRMRWAEQGDHVEDPGVDRRIILKWILENWDGAAWTGSSLLRLGTGGGLL